MSITERYCVACGAHNVKDASACFSCGRSLRVTIPLREDVSTGHIVNQRYRLLAQLGDGGFSAVYKAEDTTTGQLVAIKAVSLRRLGAREQIEATDAFNREVTLLSTLTHRNLPRIHEHSSDTECWDMVMDYIDGMTLEKILEQRGPSLFSFDEVMDLGLLLCDVLAYLHSCEPAIVYRDLKPGNIMLTRDGHLYLIDFGIARRFKPGKLRDTIPFGSPGYAAPEQYGRAQTTPATDIYSLGAVMHQLLTGSDPSHSPFSFGPLPNQERPEMARLQQLLARMVQVDAAQRPQRVIEVKQELQAIATQRYQQHGLVVNSPVVPVNSVVNFTSVNWQWQSGNVPQVLTSSYMNSAGHIILGQRPVQVQQLYIPSQPAVPKRRNVYALISLVLSIIGAFLLPASCMFNTFFLIPMANQLFRIAPLMIIMLLMPSLLGVILGIIGLRKAKQVAGLQHTIQIARDGILVGGIFLAVYLLTMGIYWWFLLSVH